MRTTAGLIVLLALAGVGRSAGSALEILRCEGPDGVPIYTNATTCAAVDANQRISIIPAAPPGREAAGTQRTRSASGAPARRSGRPATRSPPRSVSVGCRFAIGRAREIERSLRLADTPGESRWMENYCRWVCEARLDGCGDLAGYLRWSGQCPRRRSCD